MHCSRTSFAVTLLLALGLLLSGCGSSKHTVRSAESYEDKTPSVPTSANEKFEDEIMTDLGLALIAEGKKWLGVPYKYGGNDRDGVDCSGLVLQIYLAAADIKLPRNSAKQFEYCKIIEKGEMMPGDLVFFTSPNSAGAVAHVGLYTGNGIMIHASTSKGVMETPIETPYFSRNYIGGGRVPGFEKMSKSPAKANQKESQQPKAPNPEDVVKRAFEH